MIHITLLWRTGVRSGNNSRVLWSTNMKTVVTHNGKFHPDDVFAVATIMLVEGNENVTVVRTREKAVISGADWVVDVGGEYDPERLRFDHHQLGAPVRENGIDYAAFGLVWRHYGEQVCGSKAVADAREEKLVQPIDAGDVGRQLYEVNELGIRPNELNDVISSYLPPWQSELDFDEQFLLAVDFAVAYLKRLIGRREAKERMKTLAIELYDKAPDKEVIVTEVGVSASEFIEYGDVVAVVMPDHTREGYWVVTLVPIEDGSYEYKKTFPKSWGGLRDEELAKESGIKGAQFCHKNRFIFVANSKEAALKATEFLE
jgi:uncharacterized UPF0160 family protein